MAFYVVDEVVYYGVLEGVGVGGSVRGIFVLEACVGIVAVYVDV